MQYRPYTLAARPGGRGPGRPAPSAPAEQGPGRWRDHGNAPNTTTSNPPVRRNPKSS